MSIETYLVGVSACLVFAVFLRLVRIHETLRDIDKNLNCNRERKRHEAHKSSDNDKK